LLVVFGRCRAVRLLHFAAALPRVPLTLNRQWASDRNVRYRTYSARYDRIIRRYDVTITIDRDCGSSPNPAEFAVAAGQAASARAASIVSAHTASQIVSIVKVLAADRPAAVAVALAVVSDALKCPVASSIR
jgi:hypothetical protein